MPKRDDAPTKKPPPALAHLPQSEVRFPPSPPPTMVPRIMGVRVPPKPTPRARPPELEPISAPSHELTQTEGVLGPAPGARRPAKESIDSPPPISNPPPKSEPTTPLEREVVRLRAEVAEYLNRQRASIAEQPAWVEPPWWKSTTGVIKVIGAFFAGLASLGVGGWLMNQPKEEPPKPPQVADVACPKFEDQNAPRSAICMRIHAIEGSIGQLQGYRDARKEREAREKKMLGELPEVKKPEP